MKYNPGELIRLQRNDATGTIVKLVIAEQIRVVVDSTFCDAAHWGYFGKQEIFSDTSPD